MRLCRRTASRLHGWHPARPSRPVATIAIVAIVAIVTTIMIDPILGRFGPRVEVAVVFFAAIYRFAGNTESQ